MRKEIICGLDIGTSKISACVGEFIDTDRFRILGRARIDSEGLERGKVLDIEKFTRAAERIMHLIHADKDLKPGRLVLGIGTECLRIQHYRRTAAISERGREIKSSDIGNLINSALEMAVPFDHEMLHVFPQEFVVDGQSKIKDPRGMFGCKISTRILVISAPSSLLYNLKKGIYNAGCDVDSVVFSGLGSSFAFLSEEERNAGAIFLESGGGITSAIKFSEGYPVYTEIIPFGGMDIEAIIARALGISLPEAKELKEQHGSLLEQSAHRIILNKRETEITQTKLKELILPAAERILFQIKRRLESSNCLEYTPSGIILGGGSFLLEGLVEKVEDIFRLPTRLGAIGNIEDWTQDEKSLFLQSASIGLIRFDRLHTNRELPRQLEVGPLQRFIIRTKRIFEEYF